MLNRFLKLFPNTDKLNYHKYKYLWGRVGISVDEKGILLSPPAAMKMGNPERVIIELDDSGKVPVLYLHKNSSGYPSPQVNQYGARRIRCSQFVDAHDLPHGTFAGNFPEATPRILRVALK